MDELMLNNPNNDGQGGVVGPAVEGNAGVSTSTDGSGVAGRTDQNHQFNSAMKAARLQGRTEAEKSLKKQYDDELRATGVTNPLTGKPFESFDEFKAYGARLKSEQVKKDARAAGKSVEEFQEDAADREFVKRKRKEDEEQQSRRNAEQKLRDFAAADREDFVEKYPDIDPAELEKDERFRRFAKGRIYREPLAVIYEDYQEFSTEAEREALARKASKDSRGTGGGSSAGGATLTAEESRSLEEWNQRYPDMKMSAKEWKER